MNRTPPPNDDEARRLRLFTGWRWRLLLIVSWPVALGQVARARFEQWRGK